MDKPPFQSKLMALYSGNPLVTTRSTNMIINITKYSGHIHYGRFTNYFQESRLTYFQLSVTNHILNLRHERACRSLYKVYLILKTSIFPTAELCFHLGRPIFVPSTLEHNVVMKIAFIIYQI